MKIINFISVQKVTILIAIESGLTSFKGKLTIVEDLQIIRQSYIDQPLDVSRCRHLAPPCPKL